MSDIFEEYYNERRCFACGEEYGEEEPARVCWECFHRWPSDEALVEHDLQVRAELEVESGLLRLVHRRPVDEIFCCPCCAHDF